MTATTTMNGFYRACVKIYAPEPGIGEDATVFVPLFHEWIRENKLDLVLLDVADYAHTPDSPGIMLISYEASFSLDRSDGRFGLLTQRRTHFDGDSVAATAETFRHALTVAAGLEADARLKGKLAFDRAAIRVESNDRLRAPNTDEGFAAFSEVVREAATSVLGRPVTVTRINNDPRDRLAVQVA
ncbi:MAG: hypothetical protein LBG44_01155 [Gemmatimonadota bacterium]|jgi:hypothetical protein|nr:hypothetical protein [Gemmatimonadota bacterium]